MQITYAPAALRDLMAIGDFIAIDNKKRAATFVAELRAACRSLAVDSLRYPLQPQWPSIRRMPLGNYLILYRIAQDNVQIIRVVHSARDLGALTL